MHVQHIPYRRSGVLGICFGCEIGDLGNQERPLSMSAEVCRRKTGREVSQELPTEVLVQPRLLEWSLLWEAASLDG